MSLVPDLAVGVYNEPVGWNISGANETEPVPVPGCSTNTFTVCPCETLLVLYVYQNHLQVLIQTLMLH